MDPLLRTIEALDEPGCYSVTFTVGAGDDRALVIRMRGDEPVLPSADALPGWSPGSRIATGTIAVVRALHQARQGVGGSGGQLVDLDGGWDVGIGNVVLSAAGVPACVSHGDLAAAGAGVYRCDTCGAAARYDQQP